MQTKSNAKFLNKNLRLNDQKLTIRKVMKPYEISTLFDFTEPKNIVFVRGIPPTSRMKINLGKIFLDFGEVMSAYAIKPDKRDRSIFNGFVQYSDTAPLKDLERSITQIKGYPCCILPFINMPSFLQDKGVVLQPPNNPAMSVTKKSWLELARDDMLDHCSLNLEYRQMDASGQKGLLYAISTRLWRVNQKIESERRKRIFRLNGYARKEQFKLSTESRTKNYALKRI